MENIDIQHDVRVINAHMSYGKTKVINGLYMSVRSGSIYGLLGASGCGKSTILQCILGKMTLDSGTIHLKADRLSDVGYMPQDLCLEGELTIREIFDYYGTLFSMTKKQIERRIDTLNNILQFPDLNRYVKNISGGQGRRVSLAISILHDPKLIILDEPTVGIDPILRQGVWDELSRMVKDSKKTIIITTHYIEEATKSDCIGFMRDGVIIEEGAPQNILTRYETNSLESAFLALCFVREESKSARVDIQNVQQRDTAVGTQNQHFSKSEKSIDFIRIKALIKKNVNVFLRDHLLFFLMYALPIIQAINVNLAVGNHIKGIQIAVKNDEISSLDCRRSVVNGCILDEASNQTAISCVVMDHLLSNNYQLVEVKDYSEGESMVDNYKIRAFLYFPQNYTDGLSLYVGENRSNFDFGSSVHVHFSKDNLVMRNQIVKDVRDAVQHLIDKMSGGCFINSKIFFAPFEIDVVLGKEVKSSINNGIALFLAAGSFYFASAFSTSIMLKEKFDGLLSRSMFAGVTIMELLISLFCINTVVLVTQLIIPLCIDYIWFPNPIIVTGSLSVYFFMLLILGWIGFFYGIAIAVLTPSKLGGVYALNAMFMGCFLLSGFVWPIEGQIPWMRKLSELLPTSITGRTMNDIALRGWSWNHPSVVYSMSLIVAQFILIILFLFGMNKIKKDLWILKK